MSTRENSRMLMEMERAIRTLNREIMNPEIPELTLKQLTPMLSMVARSRTMYLKALLDISNHVEGALPGPEALQQLRDLRITYEELVHGSKALETAIERGYLDVEN